MAKTTNYSGKSGIKVSVNFAPLLEKIQKAGGDVEEATWEAARKGAKVMYDELYAQANADGVPASVTDSIRFQAERDASGNRYACKVGWAIGEYDPKNPSVAHKAIFLNYGTPRRTVKTDKMHLNIDGKWRTVGTDRGYITARGFIGRAKKKARPKIKKTQEEALQKILEGLK